GTSRSKPFLIGLRAARILPITTNSVANIRNRITFESTNPMHMLASIATTYTGRVNHGNAAENVSTAHAPSDQGRAACRAIGRPTSKGAQPAPAARSARCAITPPTSARNTKNALPNSRTFSSSCAQISLGFASFISIQLEVVAVLFGPGHRRLVLLVEDLV